MAWAVYTTTTAEATVYFGKKQNRERDARREYRTSKKGQDSINDLYILDIMREEMKDGDSRLR